MSLVNVLFEKNNLNQQNYHSKFTVFLTTHQPSMLHNHKDFATYRYLKGQILARCIKIGAIIIAAHHVVSTVLASLQELCKAVTQLKATSKGLHTYTYDRVRR